MDDRMPLRVRNVPKIERANVAVTSATFQAFSIPFFSCTITECRNAVAISHGISAAFSTGSQAQKPPHLDVGPVGAEQHADTEEGPGEERPAPRRDDPARVALAGKQCRHAERERDREPDVAEIQGRWV